MCSGRRISSPLQVISIINFLALPAGIPARSHTFSDKFSDALKHYLQGSGHPVGDEFNIIAPNEREAAIHDYTLRSRIFMRSITGSEYLSLDPDNHVSVCLMSLLSSMTDSFSKVNFVSAFANDHQWAASSVMPFSA